MQRVIGACTEETGTPERAQGTNPDPNREAASTWTLMLMDPHAQAMRQAPSSRAEPGRRRMLRLALALPLAMIAAGCGQKGPLYHPPQPGDEPNDDETSAAPAPPDSRPA